ncbi:hypothetical protein ACFX2A_046674 [Malus domestica]
MISCPYTPQQNGLAERKHRHVVETAVTLMTEAKLPAQFWFHACSHAAFLINRMPCRILNMKSPYQVLIGQEPDVQNLKIFGSAVYPFMRPYNANKLEPRTTQCVFLGYMMGYKGVICYNLGSGKLILSRHVVHDEEIFPYWHIQVSKVQQSSSSSFQNSRPIVIQLPRDTITPSPVHQDRGYAQAIEVISHSEGSDPVTSGYSDMAVSHPSESAVSQHSDHQVSSSQHHYSSPPDSRLSNSQAIVLNDIQAQNGNEHSMVTR